MGDSLQDAYTAVFNPVEDDEAVLANAGAEVEEFLDPAAKLMRFTDYDFTKQAEDVQENSEIKQEAINLLVSLTCKSIEIEALQHDPPDLRSPEEIESLLNAKINPSALRELGLSYYNQEQFSFSSNDKKALYCGNYRIQNTAFPEICKSAPPAKLPSCYPSMSNINSRCVQKKPGT